MLSVAINNSFNWILIVNLQSKPLQYDVDNTFMNHIIVLCLSIKFYLVNPHCTKD
jgi:hypothetical protein